MTRSTGERITEAQLLAGVRAMARHFGWLVYHTKWSIKSEPGYPDLTLVRPPRVIFAELKGQRGRLTPKQQEWADQLRACPDVEYHVWQPWAWTDRDSQGRSTFERILSR